MNLRRCTLTLAVLIGSGSAFAASDPFDPEHFLAPYGALTLPLIGSESAGAEAFEVGILEVAQQTPIRNAPGSEAEEDLTVPSPQVEPAARGSSNLVDARQAETAALTAMDRAALSETTGSMAVAETPAREPNIVVDAREAATAALIAMDRAAVSAITGSIAVAEDSAPLDSSKFVDPREAETVALMNGDLASLSDSGSIAVAQTGVEPAALDSSKFVDPREAETAALIAIDLATLSEITGSITVTETAVELAEHGYEDR
jgi:hypothetical protein